LPALDSGDQATARAMAKQTIAALEAARADWIVTAAASCAIAIMHDYAHLLRDEPSWRERAEALAARTLDLVSFLDRVAQLPAGAVAPPPPDNGGLRSPPLSGGGGMGPLTYHSFCQSTNVLGIANLAPRLLREVCGLELRELPEAEVCCGFGGSTSLDHPEVAREIARRKLDNVARAEAATLVTDNPGCLLHLRGAAAARRLPLRVAHVAEIMAERLPGVEEGRKQP
jgi:Fe-S oxidoreductase